MQNAANIMALSIKQVSQLEWQDPKPQFTPPKITMVYKPT